MDLSADSLIASLAVSALGFALFRYGQKQVRAPQFVVGLVLMVAPYFAQSAGSTLGLAGLLVGGMVLALRAGS